jgi:glycosyltransferase involved in cell wall biosynthesis
VVVADDESSDLTTDFCRAFSAPFVLRYFRQRNAGPGAARRLGVKEARGEFILLFNDDTIASSGLLAEHLRVLEQCAHGRYAVLGDFRYPPAASRRALTYFLATNPFFFPQMNMEAGTQSKNAYFIASNLSVRRSAILEVGSFDPRFRVAEDTELGVRLRRGGYDVIYDPLAWAWHDHLQFTTHDLVRRARVYAEAEYQLLRKHPSLLGGGKGQFGALDDRGAANLAAKVESLRADIPAAVRALAQFDALDFLPFFDRTMGESTAAGEVMKLFERAVPAVFWFYLWERFLEVWAQDSGRSADEWIGAARKDSASEVPCHN